MKNRGLETAVVWGRTASTFDRAGDIIYLANYFSSKVGQGFDVPPFNARAYCSVVLKQGREPVLVADDPDVHAGVVPVSDSGLPMIRLPEPSRFSPASGQADRSVSRGAISSLSSTGTSWFIIRPALSGVSATISSVASGFASPQRNATSFAGAAKSPRWP